MFYTVLFESPILDFLVCNLYNSLAEKRKMDILFIIFISIIFPFYTQLK